jgi:hypothetical protein
MSERKILPIIMNRFGNDVIKLTKSNFKNEIFWEVSDEHFLSVIGLYIAVEKNVNTFRDMIAESYALLQEYQSWDSLSRILLSTSNQNLKNALIEDALFDVTEGWEFEEERRKNLTLFTSFKRLKIIEDKIAEIIRLGQFSKDYILP